VRNSLAVLAACTAIACENPPQRPGSIRASAEADGVHVSWEAVPGALSYRVQLFDLDSGAQLSPAVSTRGNGALVPGVFSRAAGVRVDAAPGASGVGFVSAGAGGGDGSAWQIFSPQDFHGGSLHARFAALEAHERLGILLVNAGGRDGAQALVRVQGVDSEQPQRTAPQRQASRALPPAPLHDAVRAAQAIDVREAADPEPLSQRRSFCVVPGLDFSRHLRKRATLAAGTQHAEFYVDDDDLAHYQPDFVPALARAFEERVWPAITSAFGAPTDVDRNGKLLVLLSHELGAHQGGGWLIGYFGNADLLRSRDDSQDCSSGGSNHGEIVFLNDVQNGGANGWSAQDLAGSVFPATLAHEMQHLLNLGRRCVERACDGPEETWINEGLSKVAEDLAGYGWNGDEGRAEGARYLGRDGGDLRGYDGRSLTMWEGDPIGNYQGAHSFLRLFVDRFGGSLAGAIESDQGGVAGLEEALQRPLPRAMAEWATALLTSNEPGAAYGFSGAQWSPLHRRLRHLDTIAPGPMSLRADGIAAAMSAPGLGGPAEVLVHSDEAVPPHVVVLRAPAALPQR
jgi:hypothetical protein